MNTRNKDQSQMASIATASKSSSEGAAQLLDAALTEEPSRVLTEEQRAALAVDVAWLAWRSEFRRRMIKIPSRR